MRPPQEALNRTGYLIYCLGNQNPLSFEEWQKITPPFDPELFLRNIQEQSKKEQIKFAEEILKMVSDNTDQYDGDFDKESFIKQLLSEFEISRK